MLRVRDLTLGYGADPVLTGVDLEVKTGQFVALLGPSGSGKTSVLRAIVGLQRPESGSVAIDAAPNDIGFLFQDDALLPWRSARHNVALGLRIRGWSKGDANAEAEGWLARLGLTGLEQRYPRQLSGGQRKRVAIAQVLALRPKLLLMDEPFASLDAIVRARITQDLLDLVQREGTTVVLVTHDLEEAIAASDVVHVLSTGPRAHVRSTRDVPIPRPRDLLEVRGHPAFGSLVRQLWHDLSDAPEARLMDQAA